MNDQDVLSMGRVHVVLLQVVMVVLTVTESDADSDLIERYQDSVFALGQFVKRVHSSGSFFPG